MSFGAGTTFSHAESVVQGHGDEHYRVGSPVVQIGAGLQVRASGILLRIHAGLGVGTQRLNG